MLVIDWVTTKTLSEGNTGISWRFTEKLDDLDYAEDLALLSTEYKKTATVEE